MRTLNQILQGEPLREFLTECMINPRKWCERVMQDPKDESKGLSIKDFHMDWFYTFLNKTRGSVQAPRGHGKTTILAICFPLWDCFFKKNQEFVIISSSLRQAMKVLEKIKFAIKDNELLTQLIPPKIDLVWTKTEINLKGRNKIYCQPYNDNLRGDHPDFVFADEVSRYKNKTFFYRAIAPLLNRREGHMMAIGTPMTPIDLLAELKTNKMYTTKIYRAITKEGKALWPEVFPLEKLKAIKEEIGPVAFNSEYLCNILSSETAVFSWKDILPCLNPDLTFENYKEKEAEYIIGADFALAERGDFTVLVVIKLLGEPRKYQIVHLDRFRGLGPEVIQDKIHELSKLYNPINIVVDESSFGVVISEELRSRGLFIEGFKAWSTQRNNLLMNLSAVISARKLIIPRNTENAEVTSLTDVLIQELNEFIRTTTTTGQMTFQGGKHDDSVMALALACFGAKGTSKFMVAFEAPD